MKIKKGDRVKFKPDIAGEILEGRIIEIPPNPEHNITVKTDTHYWFVSRELLIGQN